MQPDPCGEHSVRYRLSILATIACALTVASPAGARQVYSAKAVSFTVSKPARTRASAADSAPARIHPRINPLAAQPDHGHRGTWTRGRAPADPLAGQSHYTSGQTPPLDIRFK